MTWIYIACSKDPFQNKKIYIYSNRSCILVSNNNISSTFMNDCSTANGQSNGRQRDENKKSLNKVLTFFG